MKKLISLTLIFLILFLVIDYKSYYYGFGTGFFNEKLPKEFKITLAGSDLGNQGFIIEDQAMMGIYLMKADDSILLEKEEIFVNKITGYYFTKESLIVVVRDEINENHKIQISLDKIDEIWRYEYNFREVDIVDKDYKFVNLDYPLDYFKHFKLIRNIILLFFICFLILVIYLKFKTNISYNKRRNDEKYHK